MAFHRGTRAAATDGGGRRPGIVAGDVAEVDRLYAEDIVIWHNYDGIDRNKTEGLATIAAIQGELDSALLSIRPPVVRSVSSLNLE